MINTLAVATGGYITPFVKKSLAISVDGYLIETEIQTIPFEPDKGGAGISKYSGFGKFYYKKQEDELMIVLKAWFHIQNF